MLTNSILYISLIRFLFKQEQQEQKKNDFLVTNFFCFAPFLFFIEPSTDIAAPEQGNNDSNVEKMVNQILNAKNAKRVILKQSFSI